MAVFPTAYFGSIAYFQQLLRFDGADIEVWDTFPKQTFRNRCTVLSPQGPHRLTLPVEKPDGSRTLTKDIRISDTQDWRANHWRAIKSNYAAAPYFEHYAPDIERLLFTRETNLVAYNTLITETIAGFFGYAPRLNTTTDFVPVENAPDDYRPAAFDDPQSETYVQNVYTQVLFTEMKFQPNPSILDLLFCEGPLGRKTLSFAKK